jgi:hypothetical protein
MKKIKIVCTNIYAFILPILGGLLGAFGGAGEKSLRRILIPILIMGLAYLETDSILVITICSMIAVLSIGYGIPEGIDTGSDLGFWFYHFFHENKLLANIFTRGTIGLLIGLSLISIPIIKHNWKIYSIGLIGIILVQSLISWRGFGTFKLFDKELSWVEFTTWGLITLFAVLIIKLGGIK